MTSPAIHYRARLIKGGPFVGVAVIFDGPMVDGEIQDRSPRYQAVVGNERDGRMILQGGAVPIEVDGITLRSLERITAAEHAYLLAHQEWATAGGNHPRARPREAVDFNTLPMRF
jgi:hypothetical protein